MKLSAPPPPPPEPTEPNPNPEAGTPAEPAAAPAPPATAKPVAWPAWFAGADFILAALAIALAFLLASFVARNSDLWVHLAAGKRILAGEYFPGGTDPFSYSAADRTWVNHAWLFDIGAYLLYGGNGVVLGVVKGLVVALAFALLIAIRRPGYSLWPWAAVAAVAAIAAAPRLVLGPIVGSVLLLSVTLFLLFRMEHRPGSWRFPIAIGITFWVWANVDGWFIVGPLTLALVLLGELVDRRSRSSTPAGDEPLGPLPDVPTLAKALAVGVVACMLNPHHVRVWELPFELVGAPGVKVDPRIRTFLWTPLDGDYSKQPALGYNVNGLAYVVLFIGGGLAMGLGVGRLRISHLALWIGFAGLSLLSVFVIPFFAVVAVPLVASQLNSLSTSIQLRSWGDPRTRFVLLGSASGRVLCLVAVLVACVLAWPGWMHPQTANPAFTRRVAWGVEPEGGMVRAAEQLQAWRANGQLPPEARGILTSVDLANYCAWFAPLEKVYVNSRYNHHRAELPAFLAVRSALGLLRLDDEPDSKKVDEELGRLGAEYVAITTGPSDGERLQTLARVATARTWLEADRWSPWYIDGRTGISGWRSKPGAEKPTFAALQIDPIALAFGPSVEPLPPGTTVPLPPPVGWETEFIHGFTLAPPGADEALGWLDYKEALQVLYADRQKEDYQKQLPRVIGLTFGSALTGPWTMLATKQVADDQFLQGLPADDRLRAIPFLALRAARRAIAADPDHPDGYYALARVLKDGGLPMSDADRTLAVITAYRQCLARLPSPEHYKPGVYRVSATGVAAELAFLHLGQQVGPTTFTGMPINTLSLLPLRLSEGTGYVEEARDAQGRSRMRLVPPSELAQLPPGEQMRIRNTGMPYLLALDLGREYLKRATEYAPLELSADRAKDTGNQLKEGLKVVEEALIKANKAYEQQKLARGGQMRPRDQFREALRNNLVGEALRILTDKDIDPDREFGPDPVQIAAAGIQRLALELAVGRLEDVNADLDRVAERVQAAASRPDGQNLAVLLRGMTYQKLYMEGNYAEAGRVMEQLEGGSIDRDPFKPQRDRFRPDIYTKLGTRLNTWAQAAPWLALLSPTPQDMVARLTIPPAALSGFGTDEAGNPHLGYLTLLQDLANRRNRETDFFYRRGLLSLMEGDIPTARARFLATRLPAVPEWGLPELRNPQAEPYLELIDRAAKKAK